MNYYMVEINCFILCGPDHNYILFCQRNGILVTPLDAIEFCKIKHSHECLKVYVQNYFEKLLSSVYILYDFSIWL